MLSKRLQKILDLISAQKSQVLADIGTDHGQLPIKAVQLGLVGKAYAIDLRKKPLQLAQKNIQQAGLEKEIIPLLADGLKFLSLIPKTKIDYCVISGLGSNTIKDILKDDHDCINNYLICANTQITDLRIWANQKQYTIVHEEFLVDHEHHYWILMVNKNKSFEICKNEDFGDFKWHKNNQDYKKYLNDLFNYHQKIIKQVDNVIIQEEFEVKNQKIQEYLRLWN